jgi:hypothetical protein
VEIVIEVSWWEGGVVVGAVGLPGVIARALDFGHAVVTDVVGFEDQAAIE